MRLLHTRIPVVACALIVACSEEPPTESPLGEKLLETRIAIRETTIVATSSRTYKQPIAMNGPQSLLGRYQGYVAYTAVKFTVPSIDTVLVLSATVKLPGVSRFGDTTAALSFTTHKINSSWTETALAWRDISSSFYDSATSIGSYSAASVADTQMVEFAITDTGLVREWFASSTASTRYGILLVPSSSTQIVRGFTAYPVFRDTTGPKLEVIVRGPTGVLDTLAYTNGIDTFAGNVDGLESDSLHMYLQAGVVYRSIATFDISFLRRGTIVNYARVLLRMDPAASLFSRPSTELTFHGRQVISGTDTVLLENFFGLGKRATGAPDLFAVEARHSVQTWIEGTNNGNGFLSIPNKEFGSFDRFAFHSAVAVDSLRPRLYIMYSLLQ